MAVQNSNFHIRPFRNSAFSPTSAYYSHQQLNANSTFVNTSIATYENLPYSDLKQTKSYIQSDEIVALQMQHLRFPTPPITPPYTSALYEYNKFATTNINTSRTSHTVKDIRIQSATMKIDQNHTEDMVVDIVGLDDDAVTDDAEVLRLERMTVPAMSMTSTTSSASSSPNQNEFTCEWIDCSRDHNTLEALAEHVTKIHAVASPTDGLYYCRWNGCVHIRGFSARYKMLVHVRTHTKEKPHKCHLCTKSFSRAENLKIHIRSHSGEKPYICTYEGCTKAYSNSSDRFKHTRTHAIDKPYMCKIPGCQKRYTDPSSLRKHTKTFKHTTQLIATAALTPCKEALFGGATTTVGQPTFFKHTHKPITMPNLMRNTSGVHSNRHLHNHVFAKSLSDVSVPVCQLCMPKPPQPHYLNTMKDELRSIKAAQIDYYLATKGSSSACSSIASNSWSSHVHSDTSNGLSMELDTPLDLRVNRR